MSETSNAGMSGPLGDAMNNAWQIMLGLLVRPGFYVEMVMVAVAILIGCFLSIIIRGRIVRYFEQHPPRKIDKSLFIRPLRLLPATFAFFCLSLTKPFAVRYAQGGEWVTATMQVTLAFLAGQVLVMVIKSRPVAYFFAIVIMALTLLDVSGFMEGTKAALASIAFDFGKVHLSMLGLVQGLIMLVLVFWIATTCSSLLEQYLQRSARLNYSTRELIVKFFKIIVYFIAFVITLGAMGIDLTALAIFGGALGVGVGLGLQKLTANFVSGITLLMEKSIRLGDLIEVGGLTGWVRQLNIRYALIETMDGRELLVPNEQLISTQVTNWTHSNDHARVEFKIGVAYDSDIEQVHALVMEAIRSSDQLLDTPKPQCFLSEFGDFALIFKVSFWVRDIKEGRAAQQDVVMRAILRKFNENGVTIPFPKRVVKLISQ